MFCSRSIVTMRQKKRKNVYLTIEQRRNILLKGGIMPTAIFTADKSEFIVKPRGTIFGIERKKKRRSIV